LPKPVVYSVMRLHFTREGNVLRTEVIESSSVSELDRAADAALMKCRWVGSNAASPSTPIDVRYEWR
jgi:outer membrane biosynthesis protein TonB